MKVRAPSKATSAAVEYFLYAIIIIQTAIAAFAYKNLSEVELLQSGAVAYLAVIYVGVLGWVFYQLNRLHGKRKADMPTPVRPEAQPSEAGGETVSESVIAAAPQTGGQPAPVAGTIPAGLVFGITRTKLLIVLVVFLAALKIFSWALGTLLKP